MPTYQYACTNPECGNRFELVQAFTDPSVTECPVCGQPVRKVYGSVGVVFKGSGFYRNDSRADVKGTNSAGRDSSDSSGSSNKDSSSGKDSSSDSSGASAKESSAAKDSASSASSAKDSSSKSSSGSGSSSGSSSGKAAASA